MTEDKVPGSLPALFATALIHQKVFVMVEP
jgi:hypothetical protein